MLASKRIDFYDYLRALAIVFVVIAHHQLENIPGGSIGVSIFFCLSGFLITTLLLEQDSLNMAGIRRFVIRRWMRVYPAYLVALAIILLLMVLKRNPRLPDYLGALPGLATFTTLPKDWLGMGVGVFWTLHVEFWFYVTLPFMMLILGRRRALFAAALVFIAVSWTFKYFTANGSAFQGSPLHFLLWADGLFYGTMVAMLVKVKRFEPSRWSCGILSVACLVGLEALALYVPNTKLTTWLLESSAASLLTAGMIFSYVKAPLLHIRCAPFAWLGRISYSVYLLHAITIDYGWDVWPLKGAHIGRFAGVTACILMLHYWVEKPGIRFGRRLTSEASRKADASQTIVAGTASGLNLPPGSDATVLPP